MNTIAVPGRAADIGLGVLLLSIIALMIVPIPTPLLDVLLAGNIAISVLMLLVSIAIPDGLAFTAMPTVLLVTTLYRLALNVSSTRLILLQADAGQVIASFGEFVVRGNYAVGAVIFLILTLIQYVVVARGAERVAEVGARFALDAMPGKQMAVDADLRAGSLTPDGARERRRTLEREAQFYGAMDGAMKFVKGDAIAGIVITVINLVAGVGIGVGMRKLGVGESLQTYGLLTIGDGLVCQIPSLLISASAGLVVTRVASAERGATLGRDMSSQLFGNPKVLAMAASFLALLAIIPGLPGLPFAFLAGLLGVSSYGLYNAAQRTPAAPGRETSASKLPPMGPLSIELGRDLAESLRPLLGAKLEALREQVFTDLGIELPAIPVRTLAGVHAELPAQAYVLVLHDVPAHRGELAAVDDRALACALLTSRLDTLIRRHASTLLGLQETQALLDGLHKSAPALVQAVVPRPVSLKLLADVLRGLLAEGVSIRGLGQILETLATEAAASTDAALLIERVRLRLSRQLTYAHAEGGSIAVHAVDPMIEDALRDALPNKAEGYSTYSVLALPPDQAQDIVDAVRRATAEDSGGRTVLVTQPDVRRHLHRLLATELPEVAVLSYPELAPDVQVQRRAPVRIGRQGA